eukprot:2993724-Pyramimonas_sp.AAC.1
MGVGMPPIGVRMPPEEAPPAEPGPVGESKASPGLGKPRLWTSPPSSEAPPSPSSKDSASSGARP